MTIPDQVPRVVSTADGVATEYSYHFYAPDPSHVFVASNGALVSSGWQAVKTSDDDGYIKFNTAPASGVELTIYRSTPMTQETVWSNGEAFYADTLTSAANKLTMIAQELRGGTVNVPGTVVSANWASSARIASSATSAGSATRAVSATSAVYATHAVSATKAGSASYHGPFEARPGNTSMGYDYYNVSGGMVSVNGSNYEVASAQTSGASGAASRTVYLVGSSAAGSAPTFSFTTTEPTSASGQFYAPIATFVGAEVTQLQFGNIVDTNWGAGGGGGGDVNFASSAGVANNLVASAAEEIVSAAIASAGIEAAIASGSATVTLTGGTGAVVFKGAGAATITSGSSGEVIVSATGGGGDAGFPNFSGGVTIQGGTTYGPYATNGWLIGSIRNPSGLADSGNCECILSLNGTGIPAVPVTLFDVNGLIFSNTIPIVAVPVTFPIPAGVSFSLNVSAASYTADVSLKYYPCLLPTTKEKQLWQTTNLPSAWRASTPRLCTVSWKTETRRSS